MLSNRRVLMPLRRGLGVAVHRIADPQHRAAASCAPPRPAAAASSATLSAPMRWISVIRPGSRSGRARRAGRRATRCVIAGPILIAERVADAAEELDVRAVELRGAHADPREVRRQVVPAGPARDLPRLRLLVGQRERLVAREDVDAAQHLGLDAGDRRRRSRATRGSTSTIALVLRARAASRSRERDVPVLGVVQVGEAAVDQRADEVERERRRARSARSISSGSGVAVGGGERRRG